ncbi:hypothetical protein [Pseudaminobacter soli (ex Li et al. 2025)]|uniref:hypothetical protein n=1 Tax=Pseudaminobacter soli (ex Li et al. 2025) TaxID=1295366 RepID=UPI0011B1CFE3|nr:hypothetical protein [Mesorhizobium soli]
MEATGAIGGAANGWMRRNSFSRKDRRLVISRGTCVDDHMPEGRLHLEFARSQIRLGQVPGVDCGARPPLGNLQMPLTSEKIWLALQGSAGSDNQVDD